MSGGLKPDEIVQLELGGEEFSLAFGMEAFEHYQRATGHSILREPITEADLADVVRCMALLHAGIRTLHPTVSREDLVRRLGLRDMPRVQAALREALQAVSDPEAKEGEEEDPPEAQGSPGTSSGHSQGTTSD